MPEFSFDGTSHLEIAYLLVVCGSSDKLQILEGWINVSFEAVHLIWERVSPIFSVTGDKARYE